MNEYIDDKALDVIEYHMDLLVKGVKVFLESVLSDKNFLDEYVYDYTLALFLMEMYDDDIDKLVRDLISQGFHKWDTLDKWNKYRASGGQDIQCVYERLAYTDKGIPSKDNLEEDISKYIHIDYSKYQNLVDFTCTDSDYVGVNDLTLPVIGGKINAFNYPRNMWDELYVAVSSHTIEQYFDVGSIETEPLNQKFYGFINSYGQSLIRPGRFNVIFMTLRQYLNNMYNDPDNVLDELTIRTAIPKNIVEKYNLPIYEE